MQKLINLFALALVSLAMTGCASVFNPYKEHFACSKTEGGKCGSVEDAYDVSLTKSEPRPPVAATVKTAPSSPEGYYPVAAAVKTASNSPEGDYRDAMYKRLSGLLTEPVTPVVAPPEVLRILLLSYTGDKNELYMPRYVYTFVSESKWVLEEQTKRLEVKD